MSSSVFTGTGTGTGFGSLLISGCTDCCIICGFVYVDIDWTWFDIETDGIDDVAGTFIIGGCIGFCITYIADQWFKIMIE